MIARWLAVADHAQGQPLRVVREWILVEFEHIFRQRRADPLSALRIQRFIGQYRSPQAYAQPKRLFVKPNVQTRQTRRVDQRDHAGFSAPGVIGRFGIGKPYAEDSVTGDSPLVEHCQSVALFRCETLYRIAV